MASLLAPIRARLQLVLRRRAVLPLQGEHVSVLRDSSLEFEDLREYTPGDNVADIDWSATARSDLPLVRRYAALRAHEVLVVLDTGRSMGAHGAELVPKRDIALELVGVLGLVAVDARARMLLLHGHAEERHWSRAGSGTRHVELLLQLLGEQLERAARPGAPRGDRASLLDAATVAPRRRALVVVVSDEQHLDAATDAALRRCAARHDVAWVTIADLDPTDPRIGTRAVITTDGDALLPGFVRRGATVAADVREAASRERDEQRARLLRSGAHPALVHGPQDVVGVVAALLERLGGARERRRR